MLKAFVYLIYGVILGSNLLRLSVTSQTIFEEGIAVNEVFTGTNDDDSYTDDSYTDFTRPSSPAETNYTSFIFTHSKNHFSDKTTREGLDISSPEVFQSKTGAQVYSVLPGTIWCGVGNLAWNDNALGYFSNTDSCCRSHDKCRLTISSGSTRFGLRNKGYFTRSHCNCDEKFYYCLKRANTIVADKVGITYFNVLKPQCFRKDFPIVACIRWYNRRCLTYVVDESDYRVWQWFDNRQY